MACLPACGGEQPAIPGMPFRTARLFQRACTTKIALCGEPRHFREILRGAFGSCVNHFDNALRIQQGSSNFKLFVDIGGDRLTSGVCQALVVLESLWCGPGSELKQPSLVVVKSEGLSEAAAVACDSQSSICNIANWWQTSSRPHGSRRQRKKQSHTTEMLKQMPACP